MTTRIKQPHITMTELIMDVSESTNIKGGTVKVVAQEIFNAIRENMEKGREVWIPSFGKFVFHARKGKTTHVVNTDNYGGRVVSPESTKIWFNPTLEWAQRHYLETADIPDELPDGTCLSARFFSIVMEKKGEEVARRLYGHQFDSLLAKYNRSSR